MNTRSPSIFQKTLYVIVLGVLIITGLGLTTHRTPAAPSTIINVTTTNDELNFDGDCSLREAIRAANTDLAVDACPAGSGADTINVPAGTYNLTQTNGAEDAKGDLDIQTDMIIQGTSAATTVLHGNMGERVMDVYSGTVVFVSGITISGGQDPNGAGGGILSQGNLRVEDSVITGNTAGSGGGIWNSGTVMTVTRSTISYNTSTSNSPNGAGIGGSPSTITTLIDSTVEGNVSGQGGAGINTYDGTFVLINSTVSNNLNTSSSNGGAGIFISGLQGTLYLVNSTVSGNTSTASLGGGLYINSGSTAHIFNSTIAYNSATSSGGIRNNGTVNFQNTIIAQNTATLVAGAPDCEGQPMNSLGYNFIGEDSFCNITGISTGMIVDADPLLGPLQDNGGVAPTHGLLYNSPAREGGNPAGCTDENGDPLTTDQRGFPRVVGNNCDMGAFESGQANIAVSITESGDPVTIGEDLIYTLTVENGGSQTATGIELINTIPENTLFVSATPSQGTCSENTGIVTCSLGTITNGNNATVDLLLAPFTTGTATNDVIVSSNEIDTNSTNNVDTETTTINPAADLTIIKTDSPDPAYTGAPLTYQINVFTGPDAVTGVTMTDPLPATFELDSVSTTTGSCAGTTTITCNLGNLSANTLVTITITGSATTTDTLVNTASVTGFPDANPNNNDSTATTTVFLSADLAITMTDNPDPVGNGLPITYTLQITNHGPSDATGVTLVDNIPFGFTDLETELSQGTCDDGPTILTCELGTIPSGGSVTVSIHLISPTEYGGTVVNNATVTANEGDPDTSNNLASQNTDVQVPFDGLIYLPIVVK
ncbi:MAG: hypothetical protein Fur0022_20820 [Anaerolineales bacterium]